MMHNNNRSKQVRPERIRSGSGAAARDQKLIARGSRSGDLQQLHLSNGQHVARQNGERQGNCLPAAGILES